MGINSHMRSIQGRLADAEAEIAMLQETVTHLTGVIDDKDALIAHYERQLALIQRALDGVKAQAQPRIRIANGNGTATA